MLWWLYHSGPDGVVRAAGGRRPRIRSPPQHARAVIAVIGEPETGDNRWYVRLTPGADAIYDTYLDELRKEGLVDVDDAIR